MNRPSLVSGIPVTTSGYRKNSPNVNSKKVLVPSNNISMLENDGTPLEKGKIIGTGTTTGNKKVMTPGNRYNFKGDKSVVETPLLKTCSCWKGHSRVPGTKPCAKGSCKKD